MPAEACRRLPPSLEAAQAARTRRFCASLAASSPPAGYISSVAFGGAPPYLHTVIVHPVCSVLSARANHRSPPPARQPPPAQPRSWSSSRPPSPPSSASVDAPVDWRRAYEPSRHHHHLRWAANAGQLVLAGSHSIAHALQLGSSHSLATLAVHSSCSAAYSSQLSSSTAPQLTQLNSSQLSASQLSGTQLSSSQLSGSQLISSPSSL